MCSHFGSKSNMKITRCGHGTYHLSINDTTLHLCATDVLALMRLVAHSTEQLSEQIEMDVESETSRNLRIDRYRTN